MLSYVINYEHGLKLDDKFYRQSEGMLKAPKLFRILSGNVLDCAPKKISFPFHSSEGEFIYSFHSSILFPVLSLVPRRSLWTLELFRSLLKST